VLCGKQDSIVLGWKASILLTGNLESVDGMDGAMSFFQKQFSQMQFSHQSLPEFQNLSGFPKILVRLDLDIGYSLFPFFNFLFFFSEKQKRENVDQKTAFEKTLFVKNSSCSSGIASHCTRLVSLLPGFEFQQDPKIHLWNSSSCVRPIPFGLTSPAKLYLDYLQPSLNLNQLVKGKGKLDL